MRVCPAPGDIADITTASIRANMSGPSTIGGIIRVTVGVVILGAGWRAFVAVVSPTATHLLLSRRCTNYPGCGFFELAPSRAAGATNVTLNNIPPAAFLLCEIDFGDRMPFGRNR